MNQIFQDKSLGVKLHVIVKKIVVTTKNVVSIDYNIYFFAVCYNSYVGKLCMILSQYLGKAQLPACHMSLLTKLW